MKQRRGSLEVLKRRSRAPLPDLQAAPFGSVVCLDVGGCVGNEVDGAPIALDRSVEVILFLLDDADAADLERLSAPIAELAVDRCRLRESVHRFRQPLEILAAKAEARQAVCELRALIAAFIEGE